MAKGYKLKKSCEECGLEYRDLRNYKGLWICFKCNRKHITVISGSSQLFLEPLNVHRRSVALLLTKTQGVFMESRLKELNMKTGTYIRELIIADMMSQEKLKSKLKGCKK